MRITKIVNHGTKWPEPASDENPASLRVDGVRFRRVLVAVDFRNCTFEMLRHARALADKFNAAVEVLHVIELTPSREAAATPMLRPDSRHERRGPPGIEKTGRYSMGE